MNKLIVVDVSVAIKWRLNDEECITEARQLLRDYQEGKIDFLTTMDGKGKCQKWIWFSTKKMMEKSQWKFGLIVCRRR